jgi:hypothetical protein
LIVRYVTPPSALSQRVKTWGNVCISGHNEKATRKHAILFTGFIDKSRLHFTSKDICHYLIVESNSGTVAFFCFQVSVDVPDVKGRTEILKVHASNKKFEPDVSLEVVAMRTPGFSGADLANLLNEGAILAGRRGKTAISAKEIDDSIDRIVAGMEGTIMTDGRSKSLVAYHEVGHAICG